MSPLALAVALAQGAAGDCAPLAAPELRLVEERVPAPGRKFRRRWRLAVENWQDYPDALFAAAAGLGPCGGKDGSSRLRIEVRDERDEEVQTSCALTGSGQLRWVMRLGALEKPRRGKRARPESYRLRLVDRVCRRSVDSAPIALEPLRRAADGPEAVPERADGGLPEPRILAWVQRGREVAGRTATLHWIEVENWWEFGPEWFAPEPGAPTCPDGPGIRAGFEIGGPDGETVGAFCRLPGPETLHAFWFAPPRSGVVPERVRLVVRDRRDGTVRASPLVPLR